MTLHTRFTLLFQSVNSAQLALIVFLSFLYATLSVATIYLISTLISNEDSSVGRLSPIFASIGVDTTPSHTLFVVVVSIALMVGSGLLKNNLIFRLVAYTRHSLAMTILAQFLNAPEVVVGKNQGDMKTLVLEETQQIVKQLLGPIIELTSSFLFVCVIVAFLFVTNPGLTLITMIVVGVHFLGAYLVTGDKLQSFGRSRFENNQARYSKIDDFFNLFKLVYVMRPGPFFLNRFSTNSSEMARSQYKFDATAHAPRIILDGIIFMLVVVVYLVTSGGDGGHVSASVYDLSILIMGALKLAPEAQKMYHSVGLLRFGSRTQDVVADLLSRNTLPTNQIVFDESFGLTIDFQKCYRGEYLLFSNVNIQLNAGDRVALTGPSGSGKTSLIEAFMGILPVEVQGKTMRLNVCARFGYLPQETFLITESLLDNIKLGSLGEIADDELNSFAQQLFPEVSDIEVFLQRNVQDIVSTLSVGQKQRIGLLRAVFSKPEILILDEFTSALDSRSEELVVDFIERNFRDIIIIVIGHRANSMLFCNRRLEIIEHAVVADC